MIKLRSLAAASLMTLSLAMGSASLIVPVAHAQVDAGLTQVGGTIGLSATDPRVIAARIINISLGLLGIIMLCLILYGGFLWMTSGGNPEQVERAQRVIRNAIIGVVIILSSWAIATFVINALIGATGGGGGGGGSGGGPGGGGGLPGGGGSAAFQVRSISPAGPVSIRNIEVHFILSRDIDATTAGNIQVLKASDSSVVPGTVSVSGSVATFIPTAACPAPDTTRKCFDANTGYIAKINSGLRSAAGQTIACGGFSPECQVAFTSGNLIDSAAPTAAISSPFEGQSVSADDIITVSLNASDDAGISYVDAFAGTDRIGTGTAAGTSTPRTLSTDVSWDTAGLAPGPQALHATAHDIDSNTGDSPVVNVVVRPAHCFNGARDTDETGIDCGGASCGACSGGACTSGSACASGVCTGGMCVEQPIITRISPIDGRPGTMVTISGVNFGTSTGVVHFASGVVATAPAACTAAGIPTWGPTQVVVSVPAGAVSGPIDLTNSATGLSDVSNDSRGPRLDNFTVNTVARPGLCAAVPNHGQTGDALRLVGSGLGTASDRVFFNDREISSFTAWADDAISLNTPVITPASYDVRARSGGVESNSVAYRIDERVPTAGPTIDSLSPDNGPISEYVTINGRNFGTTAGRVNFHRGASDVALADTDFPAACSVAFWSDTAITVKVPRTIRAGLGDEPITPGAYQIEVERNDSQRSNTLPFAINTSTPHPGICAIQPNAGPVDTEVALIGERFGADGTVNFSGAGTTRLPAIVSAGAWTSNRITTHVPSGAQTGRVDVTTLSQVSNGMNFAVRNCNEDASICSAGETCCHNGACSVGGVCAAAAASAEFAWRLSTGVLPVNPTVIEECNATKPPSPSPWSGRAGGDRVCVNSDVYIRFNTPLHTPIAPGSILVRRCTAAGANPCTATTPVSAAPGYPVVGVNDGQGFIQFRSAALWDGSATYQVILTTGILSSTNVPMRANASCGAGNAYCFTFATRPAGEVCTVGSINVVPSPETMNDIGETADYRATPRAAEDSCIVLRADGYDWNWTASDGRASITNTIVGTRHSEQQVATANAETGADPVRINASVVEDGRRISGTGELFVRLVAPKVEANGPNCDDACLNAAIWLRFNVGMDRASLTNDDFIIKRCTNENCRTFDDTLDLSTAPAPSLSRVPGAPASDTAERYVIVYPTHTVHGGPSETLLERGRFYKVILKGGMSSIRSRSGLPLTGLNDPEGFAWKFRVKDGDNARCTVDSVAMAPGEKIETAVGERQLFTASPVSSKDQCNAEGEPLIVDRSFNWTIDQTPTVSKYINGGDGTLPSDHLIDTNPVVGPGCTSRCTPRGAAGVIGMVASCGNHVIETTDGNYCRNAARSAACAVSGAGSVGCVTIFGDACRLLAPGAKGGEECDDGAPSSACSSNCLWLPVAGGTCGDNHVTRGEQCDPGSASTTNPGCSNDCQLLGSREGSSVCGNGSVGDGEACDDGNTVSGDGCSSDCLHEGSTAVLAICGNGTIEPGETCERAGGAFASWCDSATCLKKGTATCSTPTSVNCCGNAHIDAGEDCDGGDGCSNKCLVLGSSPTYATPSFCGDGATGPGEINACEVSGGDGFADASQLGEIVGDRDPDPDGRMLSTLKAQFDDKTGNATFGLQCGFTSESSCPVGTGLDDHGCCAPRPTVVDQYPPALPDGHDICRNALIHATFNVPMDEASVRANFIVAQRTSASACPAGTTPVTRADLDLIGAPWYKRAWHSIVSFFAPQAAWADMYCQGSVPGRLTFTPIGTGTDVALTLDHALASSTEYRVIFKGDADLSNNPGDKQGIKSVRGVVSDATVNPIQWNFTTGLRICTLSSVIVRDAVTTSPNIFTVASEAHTYYAVPASVQDSRVVPLSTVAEYTWVWDGWLSSNHDVVNLAAIDDTHATISARDKNGVSYISDGLRVTHDEVNVPSSTSSIIRGSALATVILCENPWPARSIAPFSDSDRSASLAALAPAFAGGPNFFNFSTLYCRDNGAAGTVGDLPAVRVATVTPSALDASQGILRQYLFTFDDPSLRGDGIGIRIVTNPLHQSPAAWYAAKGFKGSPKSITIDGYEALQDESSIYIAAVNTSGLSSGDIFPNIYIISRNPDAQDETKNIYDQMVKNFVLNVNLQDDSQNACVYALPSGGHVVGETYHRTNGNTVDCTADWECLGLNPDLRCASFKTKMQRDIKRISDFQRMSSALDAAKENRGKYPDLQTGSFLATLSNSRWPSWSGEMSAELGTPPPSDPVNKLLTCGVCSVAASPCMSAADCPAGEACNARAGATFSGVETATCWNPDNRTFTCPRLNDANPYSVSRLYQYRALQGGDRYELSTELEGPSYDRYRPRLLTEIKNCSNINSICTSDSDCTVPSPTGGAPISTGSCVSTGGSWKYSNLCDGSTYGADSVCGNGSIGPSELCEIGDTRPAACSTTAVPSGTKLQVCNNCTEFVDGPSTICTSNALCGNGRLDRNECLGGSGFRYGQACATPGSVEECHDSRDIASSAIRCTPLPTPEVCDDGALNGTYGHCSRTCTGYDAFCGDGRLSPGETCDQGAANGAYCDAVSCTPSATCSIDCRGVSNYCGDAVVDSPNETCDTNPQTSNKALCVGGSNASNPCDTSADCPGGTCGGSAATDACTMTQGLCTNDMNANGLLDDVCSTDSNCLLAGPPRDQGQCIQYPTTRTRLCKMPDASGMPACYYKPWSACLPIGACGDGRLDPHEECDDGNRNNNDACTNLCKRNICGDDAVNVGTEECDNGARNGTRTCDADYGSTCVSCSATCRQVATSGGFCGNGVKEGPEQCDRTDFGTSTPTCRALGFDYAERVKCDHYGFWRNTATGQIYCVNRPGLACTAPCFAGAGSCPYEFVPESTYAPVEYDNYTATRVCKPDDVCAPGGFCLVTHPKKVEMLSCTTGCGFTGCKRCSDTPGDGVISAQVFDAIYSNQPVPNARVTLYNNGVRLTETYTDGDGVFRFNTINRNDECSQYYVIVDYYHDNPCTSPSGTTARPTCNGQTWPVGLTAPDEGAHGGYWAFQSGTFGYNNFRSRGLNDVNGFVYLAPRVGHDETLVIDTWNGALPPGGSMGNAFTDAHIVLAPTGSSPTDLYWGGPGNQNIDSAIPHGFLACYHQDGSVGCGGFEISPQTMKYKRGDWGLTGRYGFFLVDYSTSFSPGPAYRYFDSVSSTIRIVTEDRVYTVRPPNSTVAPTSGTCPSIPDDRKGKYWFVFSQDAGSGAITIPGAGKGLLLCEGSNLFGGTFPDETRTLPGPIQGAGF